MNQKTKAMILAAIIFFATIFVSIYFFRLKKIQQSVNYQIDSLKITEIDKSKEKKAENNVQIKTTTTKGVVVAVDKDFIEININDKKDKFNLSKDVSVFVVEGSKIEKKTIADIRIGENVSIMLNQEGSEVLSIQVGKDAGNAF
jgi:uncharacterized membrane protein YhiD involved in acid resistance